ncbi:MAG: leucine--tRNA ligase [Burkholderiaceae bacterium]|nr:leucine--tRNA ligase [Burkholderiales bacterium]MCZ8338315.1 leucine--tRNA ligase [Burkholderiaceae bacterium]
MQERYAPAEVESAAQQHWNAIDAYRAVEHDPRFPKGKYYACSMLPYPSGKLHMGHVRNYTINDVQYRHLRMNGWNVLMPMGWDAFGLPAENAAMKNGVAPARWTYENIAYMKRQMQAMGLAIDWSREIAACDPAYYRWNQWLFLRMLERGIAYRKTQVVNWDPVDQTVLANEQVIDGRGWRTGAVVEKREIPGYYLKITDYAAELLEQVEHRLDGWPERVRIMQANWIGRSIGVRFAFPHEIRGVDGALVDDGRLHVFTTRADTIMGVTFVAVAPEHPLATVAAALDAKVADFVAEARRGSVMEADLATMEKKGVATGLFVEHPLTGAKVEVWVGNYVLMSYGDGAVMGVPAHDERDFAFARKYGLPIRQVIARTGGARDGEEAFTDQRWQAWYEDKSNVACTNSGTYDGLAYEAAVEAVAADLAAKGLGDRKVQYRLRDWGISRQRYWGTPIPIIHCADCGPVPVPDDQLPVVLPEDLVPDGSGNPLAKDERFLKCACPSCGKPARRETDTMDTFVDSAWYYMRYCSPDNATAMVDARADYWMPMDQYIGGIEHAVLHLLYARFWTKVMRDVTGHVPSDPKRGLVTFDEPFTRLLCQGMVLNHIYSRRNARGGIEYFWPDDVTDVHGPDGRVTHAVLKSDGSRVEYEGVGTMSKSKNNGVDPQALIDRYGADTARLFVMFASPPEQTLEWSDSGVEGASRFLRRVWAFGHASRDAVARAASTSPAEHAGAMSAAAKALRREIHTVLKQASYDYERKQYNTVVSATMKMLNALEGAKLGATTADAAALRETLSILLRVLYPVVPHLGHGLWTALGFADAHGDLLDAPWPTVDEAALLQDELELVLQVNGRVRGALRVPASADRAAIEAAAVASEAVARHAEGRAPKKIVVVPGRLVNVVV